MIISHDAGFLNHACTEPWFFAEKTGINENQCLEGPEVGQFLVFAQSYCLNLTKWWNLFKQEGLNISAGFLILGRLEDIVHFTKQGKLEYYEGNFDAFRQGCHGVSHDPSLVDEAWCQAKDPIGC